MACRARRRVVCPGDGNRRHAPLPDPQAIQRIATYLPRLRRRRVRENAWMAVTASHGLSLSSC